MRRVVVLGLISIVGSSLAFGLAVLLTLKQLEHALQEAGDAARQAFDRQLFGARQDLEATGQAIALSHDAQQVRGLLRGTLQRQDLIFELMVLDLEGRVGEHRRRVSRSTPPQDKEPGQWVGEMKRGETWYDSVEFTETPDGNTVSFVNLLVPIPGENGETTAALQAHVDLSSLWSTVTSLRVGKNGRAFITDASGRLLVYPDLSLVRDGPTLTQLQGSSMDQLADRNLLFYRSFRGERMLGRVMPLENVPWYVVAEQPAQEALAPLLGHMALLLLLVGLLAPLVAHIVRFTRRRIVAPLAELQQGVNALALGDLKARIYLQHDDELGALGRTFNQMAGQLQRTIDTLHKRVDDLKAAEEALREAHDELEQRVQDRTAALKAANDEMKGLVYIVSHDLRAPLINLKGFAGELRATLGEVRGTLGVAAEHLNPDQQEELHRSLDQEVPEALSYIDSSVVRMDGFIDALLRLSRTGHRELLPEQVDVEALIHKILESLAYQIEQARAEIRIDPLPPVVADAMALEQIFGNLLTNALTYRDPERSLRIEITSERDAEKTLYRVQDTGRGIAADSLSKVFLPFRRVGHLNAPGEGMGLAYAQALVRRHGGRIWCSSKVGEGSVFQFTIPLHLSSAPTTDLTDVARQVADSSAPAIGF